MKYKNALTVALVSLAIFFAFAVAGGICLGAGFGEYARNSDMLNDFSDLVDYVGDFNVSVDGGSSFNHQREEDHYVRELSGDISNIVIDASGGAVTVETDESSLISVDFKGNVRSGQYTAANSAVLPSGSDVLDSAYYNCDGIIDARLEGDTLYISLDSALGLSVNIGIGNVSVGGNDSRINVLLPASYNGSVEIKNCVEDTFMRGCKLDRFALNAAAGEIEIRNCDINMLAVKALAGEVDANGKIRGVEFSDIAGEINVETVVGLENDSVIEDIAGQIEISLPFGSVLNVERDNILGMIRVDKAIYGSADAASLLVSDVMGEVSVEIDD